MIYKGKQCIMHQRLQTTPERNASIIGYSRNTTLLQGSQHHLRTCTIKLLLQPLYYIPSHHSKLRCFKDIPKQTLVTKRALEIIILYSI
jgi:hypothetical protein